MYDIVNNGDANIKVKTLPCLAETKTKKTKQNDINTVDPIHSENNKPTLKLVHFLPLTIMEYIPRVK